MLSGKDFTRKYHLDRHLLHSKCKGATVDQQKMLNCEVCNREFSRVDNLREHLRGHMGECYHVMVKTEQFSRLLCLILIDPKVRVLDKDIGKKRPYWCTF
jgi:hypothetical protein